MKHKNREWTELEQRLGVASPELLDGDKTIRAALLALAVIGVAVLSGALVFLICAAPPLQDSDPVVRALRQQVHL
jgi:hypothetical protein